VHDDLVPSQDDQGVCALLKESTPQSRPGAGRGGAGDPRADPAVRVKAATEILDRTLGKPTQEMRLEVDSQPWQEMVAAAIVPTLQAARELMDADTVEGEVVEESG
jgi:hypothetical protein